MERKYMKPVIEIERFAANEYIAACGDSGTVYNFKCDAGEKRSDYHVYLNGPDGKPSTPDDIDWSARKGYLKPYSPCGTTHEAESDSGFEKGYMYKMVKRGRDWIEDTSNPIDVIVWTENGTNTHCTTNLDMSTWETLKS